jgi:hypothetical protein
MDVLGSGVDVTLGLEIVPPSSSTRLWSPSVENEELSSRQMPPRPSFGAPSIVERREKPQILTVVQCLIDCKKTYQRHQTLKIGSANRARSALTGRMRCDDTAVVFMRRSNSNKRRLPRCMIVVEKSKRKAELVSWVPQELPARHNVTNEIGSSRQTRDRKKFCIWVAIMEAAKKRLARKQVNLLRNVPNPCDRPCEISPLKLTVFSSAPALQYVLGRRPCYRH